jgi:NAD+ synthase (glutamine-hydrolysing)
MYVNRGLVEFNSVTVYNIAINCTQEKSMVVKLNKDLGLIRIGAAIVQLRIADVDYNVGAIIECVKKAAGNGVQILAFPEMSITGYTINDLIQQQALLDKAKQGLSDLLEATARLSMVIVIGMPLVVEQKIFNCAVVMNSGSILGVIPKVYLPAYKEYYENRWFMPGRDSKTTYMELCGQRVPFGNDLLFCIKGSEALIIGVEICEDFWVPLAPHEYQSLAGATILLNISASNEILGKSDWRRTMISSESGRCLAACCYVSAGMGESSNDVIFSGHIMIAENGVILNEAERLTPGAQLLVSDIDLGRLVHDRRTQTSFNSIDRQRILPGTYRIIDTEVNDIKANKLYRDLNPHPFVPRNPNRRAERCRDIFGMQVAALANKLNGAQINRLILGVSGGLDSTLALLVAIKTMDYLKIPRDNIYAYSLPGFGTTERTENNATRLCKALGVKFTNINIRQTCEKHLQDINHDLDDEDIVFENVQARYRTELLFNIANHIGAIVLGTGDLTEVALGWATFAGDHISHYHINASVPKTLVQYLVKWVADEELKNLSASKILYDILETPISPELLRPSEGSIIQRSEDVIGPVELADFYLYPFVRFGAQPGKILFFANEVRKRKLFDGEYTLEDLYRWLKSFIERFFTNQFKRTCFPEGPKIGSVSLSPRGDWRMSSDTEAKIWLEDLESMYAKLRIRSRKG